MLGAVSQAHVLEQAVGVVGAEIRLQHGAARVFERDRQAGVEPEFGRTGIRNLLGLEHAHRIGGVHELHRALESVGKPGLRQAPVAFSGPAVRLPDERRRLAVRADRDPRMRSGARRSTPAASDSTSCRRSGRAPVASMITR